MKSFLESTRPSLALFLVVSVALIAAAMWNLEANTADRRAEAWLDLSTIGRLQADRLVAWRRVRLESVSRVARSPFVGGAVEAFVRAPDDGARAQLAAFFEEGRGAEGPTASALVGLDGTVLAAPASAAALFAGAPDAAFLRCLAARVPKLCELARAANGVVHVDAVAPVFGSDGAPLAFVVERSDARAFLFPIIERWPTQSRTAETLLVKQDGAEVLYLNELRHAPGAALTLRRPMTRTDLPAVQAALGHEGPIEGRDYRDVPVVAYSQKVPDSSWILVTKVDRAEVLEDARARAIATFGGVALLLLLMAATLAVQHHRRQVSAVRALLHTERDRAEAQERFRITLYSIGDGVIATDEAGRVQQLNPVAEALTGWTEAEARGRPVEEVFRIINETTRAAVESPVAQVLRDGLVVGLANHTLLLSRRGPEHPIADSGAPIRDAEGRTRGVVLVFRDQTEERAAQAALQVSEERFRSVFDHMLDGMAVHEIITDAEGRPANYRFLSVNPAFERLTGLRAGDLVGRTVLELMPQTEAHWIERYGHVALTGEPAEFTLPSGSLGREYHVVAFRPANRQFACVFEDVTDRERARRALAESESRHRQLFEGNRDALLTLGPPDWRLTSANPAAWELFGAPDEATLLATPPLALSPEVQPDGRPSAQGFHEAGRQALAEGSCAFEWTHRRLDGTEFPASVLLARVVLNGTPIVQGTVRDISVQRSLQARLAQSDRLASMGLLAAGVAHEINNPLTYVLSHLDGLARELAALAARTAPAGDPTLNQLAERAREALEGTQRIGGIARGLGLFSRVEQVESTQVDLVRAVTLATRVAANELRHRARLIEEYAPVPAVWAPEGRITQVFLNLLINAAHAIVDGDAQHHRVTVRTWTEDGHACGEVSDTGTGIAPEHLDRIFEPFFTTKGKGGSGLGLAISRSIVNELGGEIRVESRLGHGTRFIVRLPAVAGPRMPEPAPEPAPRPHAPVRGRVLVVDDEPALRRLIATALGRAHDVKALGSGAEAWALLERDRDFDLVLCDLMMPVLSGMDLHARVNAADPALAGRFVFMTGGAFTPNAAEYLAGRDNLVIEKPFDVYVLVRTLSERIAAAKDERADEDVPEPAGKG